MALTLITRETFQGVGTLDAATPGNLGTPHGTSAFYKRAVGPRLSGDTTANGLGWSADLRLAGGSLSKARHDITVSGANQTAGCFSCWYLVDSILPNGTNRGYFAGSYSTNGNEILGVLFDPVTGTFFHVRNGIWTATNTGVAVPLRQWFELRQQWVTSGNTISNLSVDYRLAGSSTWVPIYTAPSSFAAGATINFIRGGSINPSGSGSGFRGRYGMPALYAMSSWADRLDAIPDAIDPPAGPRTWFVDPVSGSDSNDGTSTATAWQTITKINAESEFCGLFPAASYAAGDTLTIDTRNANLLLGTASFNILTSGLNVIQLGGGRSGTGEIQAWTPILAGAWSGPIAGTTKVYQATLSETNTHIVLWEDDKWLNHPTGANLAAVQSTLESTPGSFWTNGTTIYLHPFGSTNPGSDGKAYTRSYNRGASGVSAVQMLATDLRLSGLRVRKTCLANSATNDAILGYCIQSNSAAGGVSRLENCYCDYGSKHIFGFTDNSLTRFYTLDGCQAEQGSPYGSQSPWVDYSSSASTGTARTDYLNCITNKTTGLIGSTAGTSTSEAWLTHNNGSANFQFSVINFFDCQLAGSLNTYGAAAEFYFVGGSCGGGIIRTTSGSFMRTRIRGIAPSQDGLGTTTVVDSIITPLSMAGGSAVNAQGVIIYNGCTFDLRETNSNTNQVCLFKRVAQLELIWVDNCFMGHPTLDLMILENGTSTDSFTFNNNAYKLPTASKLLLNYNDGTTTADRTFAEWQALGKDASSFTSADLKLSGSYYPLSGSPVIGAGTDRGQALDYSGRTVNRISIGALEMLVSSMNAIRNAIIPAIRNAIGPNRKSL